MGLKMTLPKEKNGMYVDFTDAYWCIEDVAYGVNEVCWTLYCYPSREVRQHQMMILTDKSIGVGSSMSDVVDGRLYLWEAVFPITDIFPEGIPLGRDAQYTAIYGFIKEYTRLPFEDVLEE